jgi:hypothetical protein
MCSVIAALQIRELSAGKAVMYRLITGAQPERRNKIEGTNQCDFCDLNGSPDEYSFFKYVWV